MADSRVSDMPEASDLTSAWLSGIQGVGPYANKKFPVTLFAPVASPTFTGTPTAPTAAATTNTTQLATTGFVQQEIAGKAPLASPALTGIPTAPTAAAATNTTQLATTAFVQQEISPLAPKASPTFTGVVTVPDASFANAKLATMETSRVKGRATAGNGAPEDLTLTQILDLVGAAAEGDMLYRGATAWSRLPKGTAGQQLRMNSGVTAPEWKSGWETIAKGSISSVAAVDFTDLSAFTSLMLMGWVLPATDNVTVFLRTSTDNGSTFDAGAGDYASLFLYANGAAPTTPQSAAGSSDTYYQLNVSGVGNAAGRGVSFKALIERFNKADLAKFISESNEVNASGNLVAMCAVGRRAASTARNALRLVASSGNLASGEYILKGLRG